MVKPQRRENSELSSTLQQAQLWAEQDATAAIELLERKRKRFKNSPELHESLAYCYEKAGRFVDALKALDRVIELDAATGQTWATSGVLLMKYNEYAQAATALKNAVKAEPKCASYRHDYGNALYHLGNVALAAEQMEQACALTDDLIPWASLATIAPGNPAYSHQDVLRIRQTYAEKLAAIENCTSQTKRGVTNRKPKVAYFSSWFNKENYMKPVWGLINAHDRSQFEIVLLTDTPANNLPGYEPCEQDAIHETGKLSNQQLRDLIQSLDIDILVDLNAYSTIPRLGVFAKPLAPVTIAWFNMYATSGFSGFDYIWGDQVTVRSEEEQAYSEEVLRLPQSYLTFTVSHAAPPVVDPPCLKNGFVTFGSLTSQYKLTDIVFDAWAKILRQVPGSRLFLGNVTLDASCNREYIQEQFHKRGVDPSRLEMKGRAPHREFLEYYNSIDIALDAFPYNGGTTTMEAVWQGVPVITFDGDRWASRTSASILAGSHMMKFVADDLESYVQTAVDLANEKDVSEKLRELRHSTRDQLLKSPACDTKSLARSVEEIFLQITEFV